MPSTSEKPTPFVYRLTAPQTLQVEADPRFADGLSAAPGMLLVETVASAVSPGTELAAWSGLAPLRPTANPYPRLMGYCNVGRVLRVGPGADTLPTGQRVAVGDLVYTHSAHRSHDLVPPAGVLSMVPGDADPVLVSTTYLFHLGYSACLRAGLQAGERVAVIGLGTLGLTAAAMAVAGGARVTGFSKHTTPETAAAFGLQAVLPKAGPQTPEAAFDLVITTTNGWDDWELALRLARPGGRIASIGFPGRGEPLPQSNPLASQYFYDKQLTVMACGYMPDLDVSEQDLRFTLKRNCQFLLERVLCGGLPAAALVAAVVPATNLAEAYNTLTTNRSSPGTIVLDWRGATTGSCAL